MGHSQGNSLTNLMLIITFKQIWPEVHQVPRKYINLIFSSNTSFVKNCGSELLIYEKCHHNIIYGTLNFNVLLPPSYYRDLWDYKHVNTENIQKVISTFDWSKAFLHLHWKFSKISFPTKPNNFTIKFPIGWIDQLHYL